MTLLRRHLRPGFGAALPPVRRTGWGRVWHAAKVSAERAVWSGRAAWRVASWAVRHPILAALAVALLVASLRWGPGATSLGAAALAGVGCIGTYVWGQAHPESYTKLVHVPVRSSWRRLVCYRRWWQPAMTTAGLTISKVDAEHLPRLGRVRAGQHFDVVRARMLPGHTVEAWAKAGEQLAQTFGIEAVRARRVRSDPRSVELRCLVRDPLTSVINVSALEAIKGRVRINADVDLSAVPIGIREDGRPLLLPANRHLLLAGESGAGKSSGLWALVCGVAPAIAAGTLKVVAIDPKATELAAGAPLWTGHCQTGRPEDAARYLEHTVKLMQERKATLQRKGLRLLEEFTEEDPAYVVIVDELAALTAWVGDAKLRRRLGEAIGLIDSQGRALGFWRWGASQLLQKEVLGSATRDLSQVRVLFRTSDPGQVDMALGQGARARGALADQIDPRTPGVCYVVEDGSPEPVRGRVAHVTDADIARVVAEYRRPAALRSVS